MSVLASVLAVLALAPFGDLRLRDDFVHGRPGATEDLHRQRITARAGATWTSTWPALLEASFRASLGSDSNRENLATFANEASDSVGVDRLAAELWSTAGDRLVVGQMRFPLRLSELVWDDDLRPIGAVALTSFDRLGWTGASLAAGYVRRAEIGEKDAGLAAAQLSYRPFESPLEAQLAILHFDQLDELARQGRVRQNTPAVGGYATDYDIVDFQIGSTLQLGGLAVAAAADLARNVAADTERDAIRLRMVVGGGAAPLGAAIGWVFQRAQRDAVLGAFNSDDWWFHSRMRGHRVWAEIGVGRQLHLRVSGFDERRDDLTRPTRRVLVELTSRIDPR